MNRKQTKKDNIMFGKDRILDDLDKSMVEFQREIDIGVQKTKRQTEIKDIVKEAIKNAIGKTCETCGCVIAIGMETQGESKIVTVRAVRANYICTSFEDKEEVRKTYYCKVHAPKPKRTATKTTKRKTKKKTNKKG